MHLDVEQIERLLAGELPEQASPAARVHLAECAECSTRYRAAQSADGEVSSLLRQLDVAPPAAISARVVMTAAAARRGGSPWGLRAAGIALVVGVAAVAYALPGSPLRQWLGPRDDGEVQPPAAQPEPPAGIAVEPGRNLVIVFARAQNQGDVRVTLGAAPTVSVLARGGKTSFSSDDARLLIDNHDPATFEIQIPSSAPRVEIRVGDRRLFLKDGNGIATGAAALNNGWIVPLRR